MYRCLSFLRDLCGDESVLCGLVFEDSGEWTMILAGFQTKLGLSRRGGVSSVVSETSPESGAREVCLESKTLLLVLERYQDGGLRDW